MNVVEQAKCHARIVQLKLAIEHHGIQVSTETVWAVLRRQAANDAQSYALADDYLTGRKPLTELMIEVTK